MFTDLLSSVFFVAALLIASLKTNYLSTHFIRSFEMGFASRNNHSVLLNWSSVNFLSKHFSLKGHKPSKKISQMAARIWYLVPFFRSSRLFKGGSLSLQAESIISTANIHMLKVWSVVAHMLTDVCQNKTN